MKILHIIPNLIKGGAQRLVLDMANALQQKGIEVRVVSLSPENEFQHLSKDLDITFINSHFIPSITGKASADCVEYNKVLKDFSPDIIHTHLYKADLLAHHCLSSNYKYFTHFHSNLEQLRRNKGLRFFSKKKLTDFYERKLLLSQYKKANTEFIVISDDSYSFYKNRVGLNEKKLHLLHNAININKFLNTRGGKELKGKKVKLITAGNLFKNKNQQFLIDVMQELRLRGVTCHLTILGDGPCRENIEKRIYQFGLNDLVDMPGHVDDVESFYSEADIYVHAALKEAFGLVFVEGMAAGLPCIALDAGGNRDIVKNDINGYLIENNNIVAFADRIADLISNSSKYEQFSKKAVETAKDYDVIHYSGKLINLYNQILIKNHVP